MTTRHGLTVLACACVLALVAAFSSPKDYEYNIVTGDPSRVQSEVNSLARKGWEPVSMGAGGAMVLSGEMNTSTSFGARLYVLMRRKR